jgi:cell division septal protein FtsQ
VARTRTRAAVLPFPGRPHRAAQLMPSGRSLLVGFGILAVAVGAYAAARETSAFELREIRVEGAPPGLSRQIRETLEPVVGESLVSLDGDEVVSLLEALPEVRAARYDRAFPHALVVTVRRERAAVVLRRGAESWLLSDRGRVIRPLERGAHPRLPRVWVPRTVQASAGAVMSEPDVLRAVAAARTLAAEGLPARVRTVRASPAGLAFVLVSGLELRLGDESDLALKLAVARDILPLVTSGSRYLDLSVPERPVAGATLNSQVEGES